jgi:GH15 family glucan-1,4-alpha-glucosidase
MADHSARPARAPHHTRRSSRIEDYAVIGDLRTAALVGKDGSIDWLCLPRFDSPACFAALLGGHDNGRWLIAPEGEISEVRRRYRDDTLILETEFDTPQGSVAVIDFMPHDGESQRTDIIRLVEGRGGEVTMRTELVFRFDYGKVIPWVRRVDDGISAVAGPASLRIRTPVELSGKDFRTRGHFTVREGETVPFALTWSPSHRPDPGPIDPMAQLRETERWWRDWSAQCTYEGRWREPVIRSLITLKALTYDPTGGIVAAATTSLPEAPGGARNWDYRYCWVRDASFTLYALLISGYREEARAWREWLLRAVAGTPEQLQTVYGVGGERELAEFEAPWLKGYANSRPVRIGNGAAVQFQLDVYGELMDAFHVSRTHGIEPIDHAWAVQRALLDFLESNWSEPDEGIWEIRGPRRHFTYSKVMAWVACDRAAKAVQRFHLHGPAERWSAMRDEIHTEVCQRGFNAKRNSFVQYYDGDTLDGSLLLMPLVGFLPVSDPRVAGTVEAIRSDLMSDGLVRRYETDAGVDGLEGSEGAFLACTFWLADNLAMMGKTEEARTVFERLLHLRNDVGLLAEEYDPHAKRLLGNFPQAFSHIALVNTAYNLSVARGPSQQRASS